MRRVPAPVQQSGNLAAVQWCARALEEPLRTVSAS